MNSARSRNTARLIDEHFEGYMQSGITEIKHDTEKLISRKQCLILPSDWLVLSKKLIE